MGTAKARGVQYCPLTLPTKAIWCQSRPWSCLQGTTVSNPSPGPAHQDNGAQPRFWSCLQDIAVPNPALVLPTNTPWCPIPGLALPPGHCSVQSTTPRHCSVQSHSCPQTVPPEAGCSGERVRGQKPTQNGNIVAPVGHHPLVSITQLSRPRVQVLALSWRLS